MALTAGTRLGSYEILSALGVGGMGEVYRARDVKLNRDVAIKVLLPSVATDPNRLARFRREAQLLASLNHQNIAHVHGFEDAGAEHALVMELVEGPTLADRIAEGGLPLEDAVAIARQIAEALAAAHERGIVHRDLKPANVKVQLDGTVKVLDFGLAKAFDPASGNELPDSATIEPAITLHGMLLGTPSYMSPEQARGQAVDKRADIWAFGCVFYEMLTRRRLFAGHTVAETLALLQTQEPDWSALPPALPPAIRTALQRCLERDRGKRIADLAAVRFVFEEAGNLASSTGDNAAPPRRADFLRPAMWMIAGAAIVAAMVGATGSFFTPVAIERALTFSILPPDGTTFPGASGGAPAVSPDGRQIAFVATGSGGPLLWVQSVDAFDARPLSGTEGAAAPFWSPDGAWLGFRAGSSLKRVSMAGGQPQVLARAAPSVFGAPAGTWSQAGSILFYGGPNNTLATVPASGGESVQATERNIELFDEQHLSPAFLPDGQHYLLLVRGGPDLQFQVWVGQMGSNQRRLLLKDVTNAQYAPPRSGGPGHILYVRNGTLMAQPFDTTGQTFTGAAVTIAENVAVTGGGGLADFSVSPSGVLAYRRGEPASEELALYDRAGTLVTGFGNRPGNPRNNVRVSPDGKWAAFTRQGDASQDVWVIDLVRGGESRFTFEGGRSPVWAPDGSQIAFLREETVYRRPFGSGGGEVVVWSGPGTLALNDWSGDGRQLLLTRWDTSKPGMTGRGLWLLPNPLDTAASHEPSLFQADALHGQFGPRLGSPRWVAFDAFDGTLRQLFVRTMPGGVEGKWQVTTNGGNTSRWRADGLELFILGGCSMLAQNIESTPAFHGGSPRVLFTAPVAFGIASGQYAQGWDVTPDGQRFLTTFPAKDTPAPAIIVVMNWERALAK